MENRDVTVTEILDSIFALQHSALLRLMRLWSETESPHEMIKGFLRVFPAYDFNIDRIGVFECRPGGVDFAIGIGIDPDQLGFKAAARLKTLGHFPNMKVTGYYGAITAAAVKKYQAAKSST